MIGENIRRIRKDKGLTQAYVARQAGITQAMLCWIERGTRNPTLQVGNRKGPGLHRRRPAGRV